MSVGSVDIVESPLTLIIRPDHACPDDNEEKIRRPENAVESETKLVVASADRPQDHGVDRDQNGHGKGYEIEEGPANVANAGEVEDDEEEGDAVEELEIGARGQARLGVVQQGREKERKAGVDAQLPEFERKFAAIESHNQREIC